MSLTTRVLIGLVAGFSLGLALAGSTSPAVATLLAVVAPVGTIFINLIRMTVIPLVASMLVASVGSLASSGALGRAGARAALIAVVTLAITATATVLIATPVLSRIQIDQGAALALRPSTALGTGPSTGLGTGPSTGLGTGPSTGLGTGPSTALGTGGPVAPAGAATTAGSPSVAQWFIDLVSPNVVKAAADGSMLPVILFAVLFGVALAGVGTERRDAVLRVMQGIADAMQRLVGGILELAPFGVFALAVPLASKLGIAAAGAVVAYIALVVALTVAAALVLLYPLGIVAGKMSPAAFVAFCTPAQAVAFASRSSLAALPAMIESGERAELPPVVARFILPLAASVFRIGAAVAMPVGVLFLARLYGATLSPAQLASVVFTVVLSSFAVPGVPGGSIIAMVPVLAAVNLPIDGIGILLAVDTIPDMFRTTANVTGSLTLAAVLRKSSY